MRLRELIRETSPGAEFTANPLEAELLLCKAFQLSRTQYWSRGDETVTDRRSLNRFRKLMARREKGEPMAHILEVREFYSREFLVNRHVLIPRPDTEILVEQALARARDGDRVLEIGAGSGCVSVTMALEKPLHVTALEISRGALSVLRKNIRRHDVRDRVTPCRGSIFPAADSRFDLIVSNPPYLSAAEWDELPKEIRSYEPRGALVGGITGMEIILEIIQRAPGFLVPGGRLLLETGWQQARETARLMKEERFTEVSIHSDLAGIERVVAGRR